MGEIILLATGGTISMRRSAEAGGNVPALDGRSLLDLAGDFGAGIRVEDWERLPAVTTLNTISGSKVALLMICPARVTSVKPMIAASDVPLITCTM